MFYYQQPQKNILGMLGLASKATPPSRVSCQCAVPWVSQTFSSYHRNFQPGAVSTSNPVEVLENSLEEIRRTSWYIENCSSLSFLGPNLNSSANQLHHHQMLEAFWHFHQATHSSTSKLNIHVVSIFLQGGLNLFSKILGKMHIFPTE